MNEVVNEIVSCLQSSINRHVKNAEVQRHGPPGHAAMLK